MKNLLKISLCLIVTFFVSGPACASPLQDHKLNHASLVQLATYFGLPTDSTMVQEMRKQWQRKPGQERWHMEELSSEKRDFVLQWAKQNGLFDAWNPTRTEYDKAFILGATTHAMRRRLNHLIKLWNDGLRVKEIVWLVGDRPLDPRVDEFTDCCKTECEGAKHLFALSDLPLEMSMLPVQFVSAPMKMEENELRRPCTEDTIYAWLETRPEACFCLFISNQPFCGTQFAAIKKVLPEAFLFDLSGEDAGHFRHSSGAAVLLDTISKWAYMESAMESEALGTQARSTAS